MSGDTAVAQRPTVRRSSDFWPSVLILGAALASFGLYRSGMALGLSFAYGGSDGAELAVAVQTLGIPHPTGYPTYVLLGQLFRLLPGHGLATHLNLFSACSAAVCVGAIAAVVLSLLRGKGAPPSRDPRRVLPEMIGGITAGAYLAVSGLFWQEALRAEVYTLHAAVASLALFQLLRYPRRGALPAAGLLLGVGLGNHVTMVFFCLGAVAFLLGPSNRPRYREWLQLAAGLVVGLSVYLYLPLRARTDPWLNWGNPVDPGAFWAHVSGSAYRALLFRTTVGEAAGRLSAAARMLLHDFAPWGTLLGGLGVVRLWKQDRPAFVATAIPGILGLVLAATYGGERSEVHLLPLYLLWAIGCGLGSGFCVERIARAVPRGTALVWVFPALALPAAILRAPALSLRGDPGPLPHLRVLAQSLPRGSILLTNKDEETFAFWYLQAVDQERTDLAVVDTRLLLWAWYREQLPTRYAGLRLPPSGNAEGDLASFLLENRARPVYAFPSVSTPPGLRREKAGEVYRIVPP